MARRVGHDELAPLGLEVPVGDVDRDPLLALCLEAIEEQREVELAALGPDGLGVGCERRQLILEQQLGFVEQASDQSALAVIDASAGNEPQQPLVLEDVELALELLRNDGAQKYPSCFFRSIDADWSRSMTRPSRSEVRVRSISPMIASTELASDSIAPVSG
jgi:hypothetical protein